ncbi:hypothetical protein T10_7222 [Trichinella papuae]|uniref:Uncharacterized protein n=1 Tax=Trichinella papuae TaxID=268474 RepID=A0A0V1MP59_9BILA|nr:hypothetical protein T10_7222 [Trichinella papuae]
MSFRKEDSSAFSSNAVRFRQPNTICIRHLTILLFSHPVSTRQKHLAVHLGRHRLNTATTNVARTEFYGQLSNLGCRFTKNFVHGVWLAVVE